MGRDKSGRGGLRPSAVRTAGYIETLYCHLHHSQNRYIRYISKDINIIPFLTHRVNESQKFASQKIIEKNIVLFEPNSKSIVIIHVTVTNQIHSKGVVAIKLPFEDVVRENTGWLMRYIRGKLRNPELAEDLLQETFLRAYRNYSSYSEDGRLKGWLGRIAQNTIYNYYNQSQRGSFITVSADDDSIIEGGLAQYLADERPTPEELVENEETIRYVMSIVANMPIQQQQIFFYRVVEGRSVEETANLTGAKAGTVKSRTHYTLEKIRKELGEDYMTNKNIKIDRGVYTMNCKKIYELLFMYARDTITAKDKAAVESHIAGCKECADIAHALKKLVPQLRFGLDDEQSHYSIAFKLKNGAHVVYFGFSVHFQNHELLNRVLAENNYKIPNGEVWIGCGHGSDIEHIAEFDKDGNRVEYEISEPQNSHVRVHYLGMKKIYYPAHWCHTVGYVLNSDNGYAPMKEAPNLYECISQNTTGNNSKSMIYMAVPGSATNVRIKRGSGVIDCDTYKFAYVDKYVTSDEANVLSFTFLWDGK